MSAMWTTSGPRSGCRGTVAPVQSYLFGHSRAEVVYDCPPSRLRQE
ncbi:hypothetical protein FHU30_000256 [Actinomadura rupiterrae]|nr:hypothetical protein [Actinomadura rupiterrae]